MAQPSDRPRRDRSARYPGAPLGECVAFVAQLDAKGLDGLPAGAIAAGLGYSNAKTNTFSARLSASRQFGLVGLDGDGYALTPLARSILHPIDPGDVPRLHRQALLAPPLYAELARRLEDKPAPDPAALANLLYHHHAITASAKESAAEAFLDSARFAGALGEDGVFRSERSSPEPVVIAPTSRRNDPVVRLDLRLWGRDSGKSIRLRAPESISAESFDRFIQAFRLLVRVEEVDEDWTTTGG